MRLWLTLLFSIVVTTGCSSEQKPPVYTVTLEPAASLAVTVRYVLETLEAEGCSMTYREFHKRLEADGSFDAERRAQENGTNVALEQLAARSTADAVIDLLIKDGFLIHDSDNNMMVLSRVGNCP